MTLKALPAFIPATLILPVLSKSAACNDEWACEISSSMRALSSDDRFRNLPREETHAGHGFVGLIEAIQRLLTLGIPGYRGLTWWVRK
ncbi:hypothetical protein SISSUDRAFT_1048294 [Sistotremastrum suecicum HHB10207 ss-3]|uniref:Uncharacterized protein n=1 Tax=Sistotremastrum suecicum HHB10207 ss-3 TaxID=1314776 RepID=A0A166CKM1_9AGAM|nr:hypothetical protein SISSUDRAFT_1048294 [Sistotremastrum suecicum HHB10207 ss-3]